MIILYLIIFLLKRTMMKLYPILLQIIIPIVVIGISLIFIYSNGDDEIKISIIDNDKTKISKLLIDDLNSYQGVKIVSNSINNCTLVIPEGYEESILTSAPMNIELIVDRENEKTEIIKEILNNYSVRICSTIKSIDTINNFDQIKSGINGSITVTNKVNYNQFTLEVINLAIGFITIFLIMFTTNALSQIVNDLNKESILRLKLKLKSISYYIIAQVITRFIIALTPLPLILLFCNFFKDKIGLNLLEITIGYLWIVLISISIGLFIISLSKNENQISAISTIIVFPSSMLSGCLWPQNLMDEKLVMISNIFPQKHLMSSLYEILINGNKNALTINLIISFIICIILMNLSIAIFQKREDLY